MIKPIIGSLNLLILALAFTMGFAGVEGEGVYEVFGLFIYVFGIWGSVLLFRK